MNLALPTYQPAWSLDARLPDVTDDVVGKYVSIRIVPFFFSSVL